VADIVVNIAHFPESLTIQIRPLGVETGQNLALAHAVRIERVSEKDANAEEDKQCHHDLGHRVAPTLAMPGSVALRKWR
jgi:hypothetical protein